MGKELDLDDVCAGNPLAMRQLAKLRAEREAMKKTLVDISRWLLSRPMRSDAEELMLARCRAALAEKGE